MKFNYLNYRTLLLILFTLLFGYTGFSQCTITGLDPTYCIDDAAVTLTGTPGGGTFSGPGMTGDVFTPADAGVGVHTITYDIPGAGGDRYYIKSIIGNPWGSTTNNTHMNSAFGPAGWTLESFEACDVATVFSAATSFVFLEGSDGHASELNTFLIANLATIEAWVSAGGSLLLNAAPNEGGDINFGFGGTTLDYPSYENNVFGVDAAHPVFLGPFLPTTTAMTGTYYSHGRILGAGYTNMLTNGADVVLAEKAWGAGHVCVGGMTTTNWHNPDPQADNYRKNLFVYLDGLASSEPCTVTQDVEVFDLPAVTATVDDDEVCDGELITFTGGGADTYAWDGGVTDGVPFAPPIGTTTYTVTGTNTTTTCVNTETIDVTVHPLPTVTASVDDDEICLGESITFTGGGADTYSWDGGVTDGVLFTPVATGTFTFTVTGTNTATGCQNTATVDVTVYDNPAVTATATPDEICLGESITFTGGGADTYTWDGGITDGVAFTPAASGTFTYTVTGTNTGSGCSNTATVDITVNDLPVVTATATPSEICEDETLTLTGGGADSYTWDGGATDGVAFTPPLGTTTYTVTGTNAGTGCQNTATVDVTVNALPTVTASADFTDICLGDDVTFTGGGADTYTWDGGVTDGVPFTPAAAGTVTYTVTGTDAATGCENTATIDVTVSDNPVVTATATPAEICIGDEVTLTGGGADIYIWDGGATDGVPFTPAGTGTFTFTVTGSFAASGCENTATVDVVVYDLPTVTASVTDSEICEGESVTFTGAGAETYVWDGGVTDGVAFTPPLGTTTYTVTGTNGGGCSSTATVDVTVNPLPTVTASVDDDEICLGDAATFTGGGADSYTWDGGVTDGVPFTPAALGTYTFTVTGTTAAGCSGTADVEITVIDCEPVTAHFDFDNNICVGDCITLTDMSEGPVVSWEWDFGGAVAPSTSTEQHPFLCFTSVGTFNVQLTVTSASGLTSSSTNTITVNETPSITALDDTIIQVGGEAILVANTTSSGVYTWSPEDELDCPDCPITSASPRENTTYTVYFIDDNGCTTQDSVKVLVNFVKGIGVPSAFSPNGDGNNDVLYVKGFGLEAINFRVFNRYGEMVFETSDQNIGWDGTFKNREENPGVFTWVLIYNLKDGNGGMLKGNSTLIR